MEICPLCRGMHTAISFVDRAIEYRTCPDCRLTYLPKKFHLSPEEQKKRYFLHQNHPGDRGYQDFLRRVMTPLLCKLLPGDRGLDFGSGPGPVLAQMIRDEGFEMAVYDPCFAADRAVLQPDYDFITCSETVEHFDDPIREFDLLNKLLRAGGWLAIMTQILETALNFETWYYRKDPTHIAFYRPETFDWIAKKYGWAMERHPQNVVLFYKAVMAGKPVGP
ncbi:MAG: hypothetical protein A2Z83_09700 [Omnitrophica bacterium GWA2_52_8]|nr:MAG: hypothetical protein A2Z83_09700 [Omnitrophica bacterium GWA2_52_8]